MLTGIAFALAAGLMWGLVFIGPLLLPEYPAMLQSFGRYLTFGLIALPLAWFSRWELRQLTRSDWFLALKLAAIGNLLFYTCLSGAVQRSGAPMSSMIFGTLPVVIPICANLLHHDRDGHLPWSKLFPAIGVILVGLICVNHAELIEQSQHATIDYLRYSIGIMLAIAGLICWTWYPMTNSNWLRTNPHRSPRVWTTAQDLATLPLALIGYVCFWGWAAATDYEFPMPLGPRPGFFVATMVVIGLFASWIATVCWNEASQRLSTARVGQLILFETLAALTYAYLLRHEWPQPITLLGITLLLAGLILALIIKPVHGVKLQTEDTILSR